MKHATMAAGPGCGLRATGPLAREAVWGVRKRAIFECGKWDPRVGDTDVLATWALVVERETWDHLATTAEELARETLALERALLARRDSWRVLGISRKTRNALALAQGGATATCGPRVMRFDFHPTDEGWAISEVNSDVPGGYIEAGPFSRLMAESLGPQEGLRFSTLPDPAKALAQALARAAEPREGVIALVHATAFSDDRSAVECVGRELLALGRESKAVAPDQLVWERTSGEARLLADPPGSQVAAIHRFFPGEWLENLPRACEWGRFFAGSPVPMTNPGSALLTQSKRHALLWDGLGVSLARWRELLPETIDVGEWRRRGEHTRPSDWVLKPAWGRIGSDIVLEGVTPEKQARRTRWWSRWFPGHWVAQRRFRARAVESPAGAVYPCLGVYVVDGRAMGIYGRAAVRPLIAETAWDVAVLREEDSLDEAPDEAPAVSGSLPGVGNLESQEVRCGHCG